MQVNGVVKHMKVKPGECSGERFKRQLKRLFKLSDSTQLEVDFTVANPFCSTGDPVVLSGLQVSVLIPLSLCHNKRPRLLFRS